MPGPEILAIYAVSENGVIGLHNDLPWRQADDLRRFKTLTSGSPVIMGRKSFEALGSKPLPKRRNIIISRNPDYQPAGAEAAGSIEEALARCADEARVWITGGASIYEDTIRSGLVTKIYETLIHAEVDGDTFFRLPDPDAWEITAAESHQADARNEYAYTYRTLVRKTPAVGI
ncbi:MAG: dihydrofolate reductase [Bacteroidia bacterium]|nr:dihydrofolate reductase [Bacteroidia bacterium]